MNRPSGRVINMMITMILEKGRELKSNDGEAVKSAQADLSGVWVGGGGWALMGALGLARGCGDGPLRRFAYCPFYFK